MQATITLTHDEWRPLVPAPDFDGRKPWDKEWAAGSPDWDVAEFMSKDIRRFNFSERFPRPAWLQRNTALLLEPVHPLMVQSGDVVAFRGHDGLAIVTTRRVLWWFSNCFDHDVPPYVVLPYVHLFYRAIGESGLSTYCPRTSLRGLMRARSAEQATPP
jgi:hypothetical protein